MRRLDDYWKQVLRGEHVFGMLLEAQGYEPFLLQGAQDMFRSKPPVFIFMKYSPFRYNLYGTSPEGLLVDFIDLGYKIRHGSEDVTVENGRVRTMAQVTGPEEFRLELVHTGMLGKLRAGELAF
eukprot:m.55418 g.55418  ORF g.55418 m.55418 type:complete len:124 (-) comp48874_c0_seq5:65-436(-)